MPSGLLCGNWGFPGPFPPMCSHGYQVQVEICVLPHIVCRDNNTSLTSRVPEVVGGVRENSFARCHADRLQVCDLSIKRADHPERVEGRCGWPVSAIGSIPS